MPLITKIATQKRRANRRNIFLDGKFAFGCNLNVVARFRLREGLSLGDEQVRSILDGEVRQECFDKAMTYLQVRLHTRSELSKKLMRREYGSKVIDAVLDDLIRLGYVDDLRFAQTMAQSGVERKKHGPRRAMVELARRGVSREVARRAVALTYESRDAMAIAREFAQKHAARLRKLEPEVARRRLAGMLQRRGFDIGDIGVVIDEALGPVGESD